jgi:hypothetical protein
MTTNTTSIEVRQILQKFQNGYTTRDKSKLDEFACYLLHSTRTVKSVGLFIQA